MYNLAAAVRALAPEVYDSHLFALEVRASALTKIRKPLTSSQARLRELDRGSES